MYCVHNIMLLYMEGYGLNLLCTVSDEGECKRQLHYSKMMT